MRYADEPSLTGEERLQVAAVLMLWTSNPKTSADLGERRIPTMGFGNR